MTQHDSSETIIVDEHLEQLEYSCERIADALARAIGKIATTEFMSTMTDLNREIMELNRKEREQSRELRETIRWELRELTADELAEVLRHIYVIKDRKE